MGLLCPFCKSLAWRPLRPQNHNRLISRAANENLIPSLPGVLNSLWTWTLLATVSTRFSHRTSRQNMSFFLGRKNLDKNAGQILTFYIWMASNWCICSWDFSSLLGETIMCVRVSMGCEVCQIWPSSSAPAASADCGCLRLREAQLMTQGQRGWTHTQNQHTGLYDPPGQE